MLPENELFLILRRCRRIKIKPLVMLCIILILLLNALFHISLELFHTEMGERNSLWLQGEKYNRILIDESGKKVLEAQYVEEDTSENLSEEDIHSNNYHPVPGAGEWGKPVYMSKREIIREKYLHKLHYYNVLVGDKISINRSLPDMRNSRQIQYDVDSLPAASVIIVFHNEAWSTLMRTVMSVVMRTPDRLLKEIILVDDASDRRYLGEELDGAVERLDKVRLLRVKERRGLVHSRLVGARNAQGDILLFLDAHCEVTIGWMEPLLDQAGRNDVFICPHIDIIHADTFLYIRHNKIQRGIFSWDLDFKWRSLSKEIEEQIHKEPSKPYPIPVMAGGLFAVKKNLFWRLGGYDEGMHIWGAENLELSWRAWQCGARVEITLCSRVAHIYRNMSPYKVPGGTKNVLGTNYARSAAVWMDEWANFYFKFHPRAAALRHLQNLEDRHALRRELKCKSFKWYLENVWKDHFFPTEARWFGRIKNEKGACMGLNDEKPRLGSPAKGIYCGNEVYRFVIYTRDGQIMADEGLCIEQGIGQAVWNHCKNEEKQIWLQKGPRLKSKAGTCLTLVVTKNKSGGVGEAITDKSCRKEQTGQIWHFEHVFWR